MKHFFSIISLVFIVSCSGGGGASNNTSSSSSSGSDSNGNTTSESLTATITINSGAAVTNSSALTLSLSGSSNVSITRYAVSESSTTPELNSSEWNTVTTGTSFSKSSNYTLANSSDGVKNLYFYISDSNSHTGNAQASITLDTTKPTGTLVIDSGNKLTQSSTITFTLTGSDATSGIVAYAYTTSSTAPTAGSTAWTSITKTASLSRTSDTATLSAPLSGKKTYYGWIKDAAGNISAALMDDIEVLKIFTTNSGNHFGQYSSIALDSDNAPYISTYQSTSTSLSYFIFDEATQVLSHGTVEDTAGINLGTGTSIAVDSNNHLHIAYRDETNSKLKYATNASGAWVKETIESGGRAPSISVDSANTVYITHHTTDNKVRYVTGSAGTWTSQIILGGDGKQYGNNSALAVDSNRKAHIVSNAGPPDKLQYATNKTGTWIEDTIISGSNAGFYSSIYITSNDSLYVAYDDDGLNVAVDSGSGWNITRIGSTFNGWTSIAVDRSGFIHIAHYETSTSDLKYSTNYSGSWQTTTLDSTGDVGNYCDIAIDSNDRIHISYYDATNQQLKYATTADVN